ncbi:MAG: hypothetical protein GTO45_25170 [Candidatus Aminicenantes bacterium]|nr:hypothetical protein [Candidatus Aminicenantes bacterium]NIM82031.1 hypothetical protein [Candidatus Aminicenantes bacterium]NIN21415.1 hypothetical protein [Candidatus Aminicenantes bacterium]NIN45242.1 hypothetical protein [Candidatus Aminicenantes bacterium]NIN88062.1 hypothetical protein [Candidatus Aminicenantes bacterium]
MLHIHSGRVAISGVTIRHGRANSGAGIRVDGGTVTIRNCLITWNTIVEGGNQEENGGAGIYAQNAKVTISGCTISNNKGNSAAGIRGGGIYIPIQYQQTCRYQELSDRRKYRK